MVLIVTVLGVMGRQEHALDMRLIKDEVPQLWRDTKADACTAGSGRVVVGAGSWRFCNGRVTTTVFVAVAIGMVLVDT